MEQNERDRRLILVSAFLYMFSSMLMNPLVAGYAEKLGAGAFVMGLIGSVMCIISLLLRPFTGFFIDRISKYAMSLIGIAMVAISALAFVFARSSVPLLLARICGGVGLCLCSISFSTWFSLLLSKDELGSGMGRYGIVYAFSMAASPAAGVWVYQHYSYTAAFLLSLAAALAGLILVNFVHFRGLPAKQHNSSGGIKLSKIFDARVLPLSALMMLLALPYFATQTYLVQYNARLGLGLRVGLYFPVYAVVLLLLRITLKTKFDKWSFSVFYLGGLICSAISYMLLMLLKNNLMLFLAAAFMACGFGLMSTVSQATSILMAAEGNEGTANNTYLLGNDCGCALGALIGSFLYKQLPIRLFYLPFMFTIPLGLTIFIIFRKSFRLHRHDRASGKISCSANDD